MKNNLPINGSYIQFNRQQWAALRKSEPLPLNEQQLLKLQGINEDLSMNEVIEIYLPLSRLLNFYINSHLNRQTIVEQFLEIKHAKTPYIISIAGSVAVGKSTTARVLQALLSHCLEHRQVELITTDSFLHPNRILQEQSLMKKKGFPESYDIDRLIKFVSDIKSGINNVTAPIYSHLTYDIIPDQQEFVGQPDILILEGLNVLQTGMDYPNATIRVSVSDFVDFSIYVDAEEQLLKQWYVSRFLKFRDGAFSDPKSYFHHYSSLPEKETVEIANQIWQEINGRNLRKHILPTKERANLILKKTEDHAIKEVMLRK